MKLVENMESFLTEAIFGAKRFVEIPEAKREELSLEDPSIGVTQVKTFLEKALEISPASCRESFIIFALNGISGRYMRIASEEFPEMGDEKFEELQSLFELSPLLEPELLQENSPKNTLSGDFLKEV